MGTSSGTRERAWRSSSSIGSGRSGAGSNLAWLDRGTCLRAAFPRAARAAFDGCSRGAETLLWTAVATRRGYPAAPARARPAAAASRRARSDVFGVSDVRFQRALRGRGGDRSPAAPAQGETRCDGQQRARGGTGDIHPVGAEPPAREVWTE